MPVNWQMGIMPDVGGNALAAFERGQEQGRQRKAQEAMATYATNPEDPNALNALAQFDPKFVMGQKQEMAAKAEKTQRDAQLESINMIGQAATWADTPEKWDKAIEYLAPRFPQLAEYRGKFSPELRMTALTQAGQLKTHYEQNEAFTLGPGSKRFGPDGKLIAEAPFAPRPVTVSEGQTAFEYNPNTPKGDLSLDTLRQHFVAQESGGNYSAVNAETGAMGAYQVMPQTGAGLAKQLGVPWRPDLMTGNTPEAKQYQDTIGQAAIQDSINAGGGDPRAIFAHYYGGPDKSKHGPRTRKYVEDMMGRLSGGGPKVIAQGAPRQPKGNEPPSGYRWKADGTLEPIPGGPAVGKGGGAPGDAPAYSQSAIDAFNRAIETADRLKKHPGFNTAVGMKGLTGGLLGGWVVPGTDAADFKAELDAMKAQVFLPMVQSMKGMGALSNAEGEKLTASIGALDPKMSEAGFTASLNRIITDLTAYRDRGTPKAAAAPAKKPAGGAKVIRYDAKGNRIP